MLVLAKNTVPQTQVEPIVIGEQTQVVNKPQAPQCKGELEQVDANTTGPHTQVDPIVIGEQTQVVNKPHAPHNNVAVIQVVPLIIGDFIQVAKQPHAPQ